MADKSRDKSMDISLTGLLATIRTASDFAVTKVKDCVEENNELSFGPDFKILVMGDIVTVTYTKNILWQEPEKATRYGLICPGYVANMLPGDARVALVKYYLRRGEKDISAIKYLADNASDEEFIDAVKDLVKQGEL